MSTKSDRVIFLRNISDKDFESLLKILRAGIVSHADVPVTEDLLRAIEKELTGTTSRHLRRRIMYFENPSYVDNQKILDLLSANFGALEYTHMPYAGELTLVIDNEKYIGGRAILKAIQNEILRINHPSPVGQPS